MDLAHTIALISSINADPSTTPDIDFQQETAKPVVIARGATVEKVEAPIQNKEPGKGIVLPERNSLDAQGFLLAMRNAGKRPNDKGALVLHPNEVRNDQIKAIHAYCGYDNRRDFGSQDMAARAKAQRELRGSPKVQETVAPSRSVAGYVAGMPQPSHRILLDLQARERCLAEAMIDAKTDQERAQHRALLDQVQKAIKELG